MTFEDLEATGPYTGIVAILLFSTDPPPKLIGVFVIDYTGRGEFDCIAEATEHWRVRSFLGACEKLLTGSENRTLDDGAGRTQNGS